MLFYAHSGIRYLVLLLGAAALVYALYGWLTKREYDNPMRILAASFAGSIHLQILTGVGVLLTRTFYPALIGHLFMMLFAAAVAQITSSVMRRRPPGSRSYLPHVVGTAVALALVAGGIMAIGRGVFQSVG